LIYWEANFPDQTIEIKSTQAEWQKYELEITNSMAYVPGVNIVPTVSVEKLHKALKIFRKPT